MSLLLVFLLFIVMHTLVWFGVNTQLIEDVSLQKSFWLCVCLAVPTSVAAFFSTKYCFEMLGTAWGVRLFAFGVSYLVFPVLTWFLLRENPFNFKTMLCIVLSLAIIVVQVTVPDN